MNALPDIDVAPLEKPENLREQIYGALLELLQRGEIGHSVRLVDTDIAKRFGTSRMPAREALLQLTNEGYLCGTTRGFRIPRLTDQDIRDIFEVRKLLEPHAAGLATGHIDARGLDRMRAAQRRAEDAATRCDLLEMIAANAEFRQQWLTAVRNQRLSSTIARFVDHVQVVRLETLKNPETQSYVATGLGEILAAFEREDSAQVTAIMAVFIGRAEDAYFELRAAQQRSAS